MASKTYVDLSAPPIDAAWLNDIDAYVYEGKANDAGGQAASIALYLQAGTGAVSRTVQARLRDIVSVKDYGAVGDGVADDTAAIQAAHDAMSSAGTCLYFPAGTYKVSSAINISKPCLIRGDGYSSNIRTSSGTANIFTLANVGQVQICFLLFSSSVLRTAGWYIDIASTASRIRVSDFAMDGAIGGIRSLAAATCTIERGQILNCVAATGIGIRLDGGLDVSIRDIIMDAGAQIFAGIYITSAGDVTIEDCQLIHGGQALSISPSAGVVIASIWAINTFFDNSTRGLLINPTGAGATVVRCIFTQCWFGSATTNGAELLTSGGALINGIEFNLCHFFLNAQNGLTIDDTGCTNIAVNGGAFAQNTLAAINIAANVTDWAVRNARIGATHGLTANGNGIVVGAGTSANYAIENNDLRGNTTLNLNDSGTGTGKYIAGNLGFGAGSAVFDPPNLADGAGTTTTVTVTGAALGDIARASFSLDLQGITLTAWVSAANTVSVRFQNESGGALDLASGTLRATIDRIS